MNTTPSCDMTLLVQAAFDGELDAAEAARMADHRLTCETCKTAHAHLQYTRQSLRDGDMYARAPDALRRNLTAALNMPAPMPRVARGNWTQRLAGFGMGAAIAAAVTLYVVTPGQRNLTDDIVAGHVRALQAEHLQDVASSDHHTVKPWFEGKLDFAPPVKDLASQGFPLTGGRLDVMDGRPVAALIYRRATHPINVFVWPAKGMVSAAKTETRNGYNVVEFVNDGMNVWMVSDVEKGELARFAELWKATP
jgi:anti-sigma factor RsiW